MNTKKIMFPIFFFLLFFYGPAIYAHSNIEITFKDGRHWSLKYDPDNQAASLAFLSKLKNELNNYNVIEYKESSEGNNETFFERYMGVEIVSNSYIKSVVLIGSRFFQKETNAYYQNYIPLIPCLGNPKIQTSDDQHRIDILMNQCDQPILPQKPTTASSTLENQDFTSASTHSNTHQLNFNTASSVLSGPTSTTLFLTDSNSFPFSSSTEIPNTIQRVTSCTYQPMTQGTIPTSSSTSQATNTDANNQIQSISKQKIREMICGLDLTIPEFCYSGLSSRSKQEIVFIVTDFGNFKYHIEEDMNKQQGELYTPKIAIIKQLKRRRGVYKRKITNYEKPNITYNDIDRSISNLHEDLKEYQKKPMTKEMQNQIWDTVNLLIILYAYKKLSNLFEILEPSEHVPQTPISLTANPAPSTSNTAQNEDEDCIVYLASPTPSTYPTDYIAYHDIKTRKARLIDGNCVYIDSPEQSSMISTTTSTSSASSTSSLNLKNKDMRLGSGNKKNKGKTKKLKLTESTNNETTSSSSSASFPINTIGQSLETLKTSFSSSQSGPPLPENLSNFMQLPPFNKSPFNDSLFEFLKILNPGMTESGLPSNTSSTDKPRDFPPLRADTSSAGSTSNKTSISSSTSSQSSSTTLDISLPSVKPLSGRREFSMEDPPFNKSPFNDSLFEFLKILNPGMTESGLPSNTSSTDKPRDFPPLRADTNSNEHTSNNTSTSPRTLTTIPSSTNAATQSMPDGSTPASSSANSQSSLTLMDTSVNKPNQDNPNNQLVLDYHREQSEPITNSKEANQVTNQNIDAEIFKYYQNRLLELESQALHSLIDQKTLKLQLEEIIKQLNALKLNQALLGELLAMVQAINTRLNLNMDIPLEKKPPIDLEKESAKNSPCPVIDEHRGLFDNLFINVDKIKNKKNYFFGEGKIYQTASNLLSTLITHLPKTLFIVPLINVEDRLKTPFMI